MTRAALQLRLELLRKELARVEEIKVQCASCLHWERGTCTKYNATPPADVQASGCDEWHWDDVPF